MTKRAPLPLAVLFLGGCAAATSGLTIPATARNGTVENIPASLYKPEGAGPFPAVVIMHDCSGLSPASSGATTGGDPKAWRESIREVDAFFARHLRR